MGIRLRLSSTTNHHCRLQAGGGEFDYDPLIAAEYSSSFGFGNTGATVTPVAKPLANNNIASNYKPSGSEIIFSIALGFTVTRKDSRRISVGEALSYDPVSGDVK